MFAQGQVRTCDRKYKVSENMVAGRSWMIDLAILTFNQPSFSRSCEVRDVLITD